jgi:hypothetical protein
MSARTFHKDGEPPDAAQIFVFGSNLSGYHGGGAARAAFDYYGAKWGVAEALTGRSYAIPTVKEKISGPLPIETIALHVERFLAYAEQHADMRFFVTRIGCGLAGHKDADIAPMFKAAPMNCSLPEPWRTFVEAA